MQGERKTWLHGRTNQWMDIDYIVTNDVENHLDKLRYFTFPWGDHHGKACQLKIRGEQGAAERRKRTSKEEKATLLEDKRHNPQRLHGAATTGGKYKNRLHQGAIGRSKGMGDKIAEEVEANKPADKAMSLGVCMCHLRR